MDSLLDLRAKLVSLKEDGVNVFLTEILEDNADFMEDVLADQMLQGLDGDGNPIRPAYSSDVYARLKQFMNSNSPLGTPDLKFSGSFHRKIQLRLKGENIEFISTDAKSEALQDKYGEEIIELNEDSVLLIQKDLILPLLNELILEKLLK